MANATTQGEMHDFTAIKYRNVIAKYVNGLTLEQSLHKIALRISEQFFDACISEIPQPINVQHALENEVILDHLCTIHKADLTTLHESLQQLAQPLIEQMLEPAEPTLLEHISTHNEKVVPLF